MFPARWRKRWDARSRRSWEKWVDTSKSWSNVASSSVPMQRRQRRPEGGTHPPERMLERVYRRRRPVLWLARSHQHSRGVAMTEQGQPTRVSRRTIAKGAAWAVPIVPLVVATPAYAATGAAPSSVSLLASSAGPVGPERFRGATARQICNNAASTSDHRREKEQRRLFTGQRREHDVVRGGLPCGRRPRLITTLSANQRRTSSRSTTSLPALRDGHRRQISHRRATHRSRPPRRTHEGLFGTATRRHTLGVLSWLP